ncbi:PhoD-like phosphatase [Phytophthora infestans]|uniref:PhoD-like phosphatase n=1 Tax=Phytophthora infestans TaxID=4787 RepID=A0A8S9VAR5_PHYIN|nr:PhoD-like phosphatase [Phytophthora infestans]
MTRSAVLLLCAWLHAAIAAIAAHSITRDINDSLLLIVGDVTSSSARILYDQVPLSATKLSIHVYDTMATTQSDLAGSAAIKTLDLLSIETETRPRVVVLQDLEPGRRYVVQLSVDEPKQVATIMFHTARAQSDGNIWTDRMVVVSCDRFVDDHDDVLMERIASDIEAHDDALGSSSVHFGTAHIGDQIYADAGELSIEIVPFSLKDMADRKKRRARYDALLEEFRFIYRKTFGRKAAQRMLRVGAHWMLPDDHEIINNFNVELIRKAFQDLKNPTFRESERERLVALQLHCRAGLQAYYEFQYQLYRDIPWDTVDFLEGALGDIIRTYPVYFAVELQQLKLLFLDVRFERSFFDLEDDQPKLVSDEQRRFLDGKLQSWSDNDNTAVVFSSMPLFFQSAFSAAIAHIVEHETYPGMAAQRSGLEGLYQIFQTYNQPTASPLIRLLVGGDLHMLAHSRVCGTEGTNSTCLDQLITSGVTNGSTSIQDAKLIPYYYLITQLTPVFEIVSSWARYIPLLSSLLPRSSPWHIEYDRVFLGRNYGILEFSSDGNFKWDQTVTEPYDEAFQRIYYRHVYA